MTDSLIELSSPSQIDLNKHGILEASAGTGKTYSIEQLILRLLTEENNGKYLALEKILVVTFTEKASFELKNRIRKNLEQKFLETENPKQKAIISTALENFFKASIFTIHGFCKKVLDQYIFETGSSFNYSLQDSEELFEKLKFLIQKKVLSEKFQEDLTLFLKILDYPKGFETAFELFKLMPSPNSNYEIVPIAKETFNLELALQKAEQILFEIESFFNHYPQFLSDFLQFKKVSFEEVILIGIKELLSNNAHSALEKILNFKDSLSSLNSKYFANFNLFQDKLLKKGLHLNDTAALLDEKINNLIQFIHSLKNDAIHLCHHLFQENIESLKNDHQALFYDDLIQLVLKAIQNKSSNLKKTLCEQYEYAFIDEFQDTDLNQWQIFKSLFFQNQNKLFIIGDPKQAIYAFRGADLSVYNKAKKEILENNGKHYLLNTNYRSTPGLIDCFNKIFSASYNSGIPIWFSSSKNPDFENFLEPRYFQLKSPQNLKNSINPLKLLELEDSSTIEILRKTIAKNYCLEIIKLLETKPMLHFYNKESKQLEASDICILCRSHTEASLIKTLLDEQNIPSYYYKQQKLFSSQQAFEVLLLFQFCSQTNNSKAALLTPFLKTPLNEIASSNELNAEVKKLLIYWQMLIKKRKWPALFNSFLYDSLLHKNSQSDKSLEQAFYIYEQIFDTLLKQALSENLSWEEIIQNHILYREESKSKKKDEIFFRNNRDQAKIQIMTIHASKGLEFPIVFLFGGFSQPRFDSNICQYFEENKDLTYTKTFSIEKTAHAKNLEEKNELDNSKRLFYVALTRASHCLYLPFIKTEKAKKAPLLSYIYSAVNQALKNDDLQGTIERFSPSASSDSSYSPQEKDFHTEGFDLNLNQTQISTRELNSFSRLSLKTSKQNEDLFLFEVKKEDDEIEDQETLYSSTTSPQYCLPGGTNTGSLVHSLFEEIDFSKAREPFENFKTNSSVDALIQAKLFQFHFSDLPQIISPKLFQYSQYNSIKQFYSLKDESYIFNSNISKNQMDQISNIFSLNNKDEYSPYCFDWLYKNELKKMLWHTLNLKLPAFQKPLCSLNEEHKSHEADFYFAYDENSLFCRRNESGFMKGSIDFIFKDENNRFYFIDWKSNLLTDSYNKEAVEKEVELHYSLQYQIYSVAFEKWLKSFLKEDFSYEENFGGLFYLFTRGIDTSTPQNGVFFLKPSEDDLQHYEKNILEILKKARG